MSPDPIRARLGTFIGPANMEGLAWEYRNALRAVLDLRATAVPINSVDWEHEYAAAWNQGYADALVDACRVIAENLGVTDDPG